MASVKDVVQKLHTLAEISANQPVIARDDRCMSGLIQFVSNSDRDVAAKALDTLFLLASHESNKQFLLAHAQLTSALDQLLRNPQTAQQLQIAAHRIVRALRVENKSDMRQPLADGSNTPSKRRQEEFEVPQMANETKRDAVQKVLMAVNGVVSINIQAVQRKVTVFGTAPFETIEKAINALGFTVKRTTGEAGKENLSAQQIVTQEMLDAEARKEKQRRDELKEKHRTTSIFSRIGRAFYLI